MEFIVVYDRIAPGNPITSIHSQRFKKSITLNDIHPEDDPAERGIVIVPGEIINGMTLRKYKRDKKGNIVRTAVLRDTTKSLNSMTDSSLNQNILIFGEPIAELASISDLSGKKISGTVVNRDKGILGIGECSGHFTVVCRVNAGLIEAQVVSESPNWRWKYDDDQNVVGMDLISEPDDQDAMAIGSARQAK